MKNKKKPTIKKLPKYTKGGPSGEYNPSDPNRLLASSEEESNSMSTNQGIAMGAAAVGSIGSAINANNPTPQPNDQFNTTFDKTFNSTSNGVSAVSPLWGGVTKAIGQIAQPIKKELNQTETGRKVNYGAGWVFAPLETGLASQKTGVWSPNEYNQQYVDQQNMNKQNSQQFAMGGMNGLPNAELEKQEVFKTPNGQIAGVNGSSHENGGVPINIPAQTKILSDKLKMDGKTFADLGSKYKTVKEDKIISDDKATSSAKATAKLTSEIKQRKLDELFNAQESMKQSKLADYAKRIGVTLPTQEFAYGGKSGKQAYDEDRQAIINENDFTTPELTTPNPYANQTLYDPSKNYTGGNMTGYNRTADDLYNQERSQIINDNTIPSERQNIPYGDYASMAANIAAPLYSLATNKKEKPIGFVKPNIRTMDPSAELRSNANANAANIKMLKNAVGGSGGAYLSNIGQIGAQNAERNANTITKYNNANSDIYNRNQSEVASITNTEKDYNRRDEAGYRNINRAAVANLGENASGVLRDNKATQQDYKTLGMISNMYPNYQYNKKTGEWKHKTTGQKLTEEEKSKIYRS